MCDTVLLHLYH